MSELQSLHKFTQNVILESIKNTIDTSKSVLVQNVQQKVKQEITDITFSLVNDLPISSVVQSLFDSPFSYYFQDLQTLTDPEFLDDLLALTGVTFVGGAVGDVVPTSNELYEITTADLSSIGVNNTYFIRFKKNARIVLGIQVYFYSDNFETQRYDVQQTYVPYYQQVAGDGSSPGYDDAQPLLTMNQLKFNKYNYNQQQLDVYTNDLITFRILTAEPIKISGIFIGIR